MASMLRPSADPTPSAPAGMDTGKRGLWHGAAVAATAMLSMPPSEIIYESQLPAEPRRHRHRPGPDAAGAGPVDQRRPGRTRRPLALGLPAARTAAGTGWRDRRLSRHR